MHANLFLVFLFQAFFALIARANLYVIQPRAGSTCTGGQPCTVEWLDDGSVPLLSQIGPCYVALCYGEQVLVQQIAPVDLSSVHSLQFTPDPHAGPNANN
ncbi:hypothetical protein BD413DRAFT_473948 [Trametes elegans]|nr:hypothetical protein BD413DRAFT_473948 [Trametes elegans]